MGGAARAASTVAQTFYDVAAAPTRGVIEVGKGLTNGQGVGTAIGRGLKTAVKPQVGFVKEAVGGVLGGGEPQSMPGAPEQPSASDQAAKAEEQRRKSLTDLAKDRPGRSQTVLTDQSAYPYRLV